MNGNMKKEVLTETKHTAIEIRSLIKTVNQVLDCLKELLLVLNTSIPSKK